MADQEEEKVILELASGDVSRDKLVEWLTDHIDDEIQSVFG